MRIVSPHCNRHKAQRPLIEGGDPLLVLGEDHKTLGGGGSSGCHSLGLLLTVEF